ncbi:hypothetical protein B0H14DRAFT_2645561 [Mycena olivaceomarginata]|nr:hypothetical protein B0H14DRAFT_2645561 [Mycena olivaceomarginata]
MQTVDFTAESHSAHCLPSSYTVLIALPTYTTNIITGWFWSPFYLPLNYYKHHISYSYTEIVALPYSPYKLEGPGYLYFALHSTATSDIDAFLDGTVLTQVQFNTLQIKAGHTAKLSSGFTSRAIDSPQAESKVHITLCRAMLQMHEEPPQVLLAHQCGGFGGVRRLVEEVFLDLGVPFVCWRTVYLSEMILLGLNNKTSYLGKFKNAQYICTNGATVTPNAPKHITTG